MIDSIPILSSLIWLPILGGIATLAAGDRRAFPLALAISLVNLALAVLLWREFASGSANMQFVESMVWLEDFAIFYSLGVDGIALPLIALTALITPLVVITANGSIKDRLAMHLSCFLIMSGLLIGVFSATDAILFYVFWEAGLIPMFLLIGIWGGANRIYAAIKFFLYTFLGSVLMLVGFIYLRLQTGSFEILEFQAYQPLSSTAQALLFWAFFAAFAVKVPMWPVHTWLPDAHVEAPTGGSVVLAALMLKMGGYGFLRLSLPVVPDASRQFSHLIVVLSLIAVVYIGFVALRQFDMKKLIAYSSIAHMGFVTLGSFLLLLPAYEGAADSHALLGLKGAMVQMISHGLISAALFCCIGVLYERMHTRMIADYGGVASRMPAFSAFAVFFAMANAGLPGTSGFVGEFMVILASFKASFWVAFFAALTLILGAAYTLWMVKRVFYGGIIYREVQRLTDIRASERLVLGVLAVFVLGLGLWPAPLIEVMDASLQRLLDLAVQTKLG